MHEFMLDIDLPPYIDADFMSRIPAQREQINRLMSEGVITSYTLALDRSKLWVVLNAESEEAVRKVFESFPLHEYMQGAVIPLMFHQSAHHALPKISMN